MPESLSHLSSSGLPLSLHPKLPLIPPVLVTPKLPDGSLISHKEIRLDRGRGRGKGLGRAHFRCSDLLVSAKERFPCSYCEYASVRRYNLERHIRLRHPSYRYKCPLPACGMILLDETELNTHIAIHDTISFVICYGCNLPFDSWGTLSRHQQVCKGFEGHPTVRVAQGGSGKGRRYKMGSLVSGSDLKQEPGDGGIQSAEHIVVSRPAEYIDTMVSRLAEYTDTVVSRPAKYTDTVVSRPAEHTDTVVSRPAEYTDTMVSRPAEYTDTVVSRLVEQTEHGGKPVEHTVLGKSSESRIVEHVERGENPARRPVVHSEISMESDGGAEVVEYTDNLPVHFLQKDHDAFEEESGQE